MDTVNKWPTAVEFVCCNEIDQCQNVAHQSVSAGSIQCITEHKGFEAVCIKYVTVHAKTSYKLAK